MAQLDPQPQEGVSESCGLLSRLTKRRVCSQAHPTGGWPQGPSVPCHIGLSTKQLQIQQPAYSTWANRRARDNTSKRQSQQDGSQSSCYSVTKVTSQHFRCVLFIKSKSLGPAPSQGAGLHRDTCTKRRSSLGATTSRSSAVQWVKEKLIPHRLALCQCILRMKISKWILFRKWSYQ